MWSLPQALASVAAIPLLCVAWAVTFLLKETPLRETAHLTVPLDAELGVESAETEPVGAAATLITDAVETPAG